MTPDVPTGAMHAVSDSAASTNEHSLYALGPRMAGHYTRGSACEHMTLRADGVSLLCAFDECASDAHGMGLATHPGILPTGSTPDVEDL
jgi:hypothetical protein